MSDCLDQEKDQQHVVESPSPAGKQGTQNRKKKHPKNKKTKKGQSEKPTIEEERKRLIKLSQEELIKVASPMRIAVHRQTVL